jgi:hypothetical protein
MQINIMWLIVAAYFVVQFYTLTAWRGGWRIAAGVSLIAMLPVAVLTFQGYRDQSNLWPVLLLFAGPPALLYLVVLMVVRTTKEKRRE